MIAPPAPHRAAARDAGAARVARVVVADDQLPFLLAMRRLVRRAPDLEIVGEAGDGAAAVELVERLRPDLVLLDVRMPGTDGPAAAATITARHPDVTVLLCSSHGVEDVPPGMPAPFLAKETLTADVLRQALAAGPDRPIVSP